MPSARRARRRSTALVRLPWLALIATGTLLGGQAALGAATGRSELHVQISVPSALTSNARRVWLANTGSTSVLELSAATGKELLDVKGTKYMLDNSDALTQYGNDIWVANEASDTVTEFSASTGEFRHLLHGPTFHFAVPVALVATAKHVFVLDMAGDKVTVVTERTAHLARYLTGPRFHFDHASALVRAGRDVWVVSSDGTLTELSGETGGVLRVLTSRATHLAHPVAATASGADLLVTNAQGSAVTELSAATGAYLGTVSTGVVALDRATSVAAVDGTVWVASTVAPAYLVGLRVRDGAVVHLFRHRFSYPAVYADTRHVWVVDREQSRVTEITPSTGKVVRTISD